MKNIINSPVLSITVTRRCNLDCTYCYFPNKGNNTITKDIVNQVIKQYFIYFLKNINNARILLSGGEPLLEKELVFYILNYTTKLGKIYNKKISFTLDTNGVLLTKDVVNNLKPYDIYIMSSIDGKKEVHDLQRPFINNNQSSYDVISENIDYALKALGKNKVAVRFTTTPDSVNVLSETFNHFYNLGFTIIDFAPNYEVSWTEKQLESFDSEINKVSQFILSNSIENKLIQNYFDFHLGKNKSISAYGHPCTIIPTVDTNGDFYACHRFIDNQDFLLGNYSKFSTIINSIRRLSKKYIIYWEKYEHLALASCPANNVCKGCNAFEVSSFFKQFINIIMKQTKNTIFNNSNLFSIATKIEFEIKHDQIDNEFILINENNGDYILLNETGFVIAQIIKEHKKMKLNNLFEIFTKMIDVEQSIDKKQIFDEVLSFLKELQHEDIIEIQND